MWRERERDVWHDIPHANGTLEADPWWGSEAYGACLDRCGGSCAALGSDETFERLREATLGDGFEPGKVPAVCFEDDTDWTWRRRRAGCERTDDGARRRRPVSYTHLTLPTICSV